MLLPIKKGKKIWAHNYHIHDLKNLNSNSVIGLLKNQNGQYYIGVINKQKGTMEKEILISKYQFDERFQYRLWKGSEIIIDEKLLIITYSPNEIYLMNKNNIT